MINFDMRLNKLKDRRQGTAQRIALEKGFTTNSGYDFRLNESYEILKENSAFKYIIGAMSPVSNDSTKVSINEGERVASTLCSLLETQNKNVSYHLQGSVALDIHIHGHSDVDMLIVNENVWQVQTPKLDGSQCYASDLRSMEDIMRELRLLCEEKLSNRYPTVDVDCSNPKSIAMEGGSLARKIDIVPACWFDSHDYQRSYFKYDRGIKIYHKKEHNLILNFPFKHIKLVNDKDHLYDGNLKKLVRLLKNLKADMPDYKKNIMDNLSSFDLVGIVYGMDDKLSCNKYRPLALLDNLRTQLMILNYLVNERDKLFVPDKTRQVFDNQNKIEALNILYAEVTDLALSVQKSMKPDLIEYNGAILQNQIVLF